MTVLVWEERVLGVGLVRETVEGWVCEEECRGLERTGAG